MPTTTLVTGGRVYDHDGDTDRPGAADILVVDDRIVAVAPDLEALLRAGHRDGPLAAVGAAGPDRVVDARGRLVLPGFVNAHYHSHDTLLKGSFETLPLEFWALLALPPSYPRRSQAELRVRTLLGASASLRAGITTIQDMDRIHPFDLDDAAVVLDAYAATGLRVVFAPHYNDQPLLDAVPYYREEIPQALHERLTNGIPLAPNGQAIGDLIEALVERHHGRHPRIRLALGPSAPERCSLELLRRTAALAERFDLPVFTHVYESRGMTLDARLGYADYGRSHIRYLAAGELLGPRLGMAHSIWLNPHEIEQVARSGARAVLNPVGNMKTRSGVAPIKAYLEAGVPLALGCDNCSCSDVQNMFQAMKLFCGLAAVTDPEPGPPFARDALRVATLGGAAALGLAGEIGALRPGYKADMTLLRLDDPAWQPLNSVARQAVFSECGRTVDTVLIDGEVVLDGGRVTTIDEAALWTEIAELMPALEHDMRRVRERLEPVWPHLERAYARICAADLGVGRFVGGR